MMSVPATHFLYGFHLVSASYVIELAWYWPLFPLFNWVLVMLESEGKSVIIF